MEQSIVADASKACQATLRACLEREILMECNWAENRLADYNLWASGIGALAQGRTSLDHRLKDRPDTRDMVLDLLRYLDETLAKCSRLADSCGAFDFNKMDEPRASSELPETPTSLMPPMSETSSISTSGEDNIQKAQKRAESTLDQLVRLSAALRRAGTRSRVVKADRQFDPEDHAELCVHLLAVIGASFRPSAPLSYRLNDVQRRLMQANLLRRNRFIYAQNHGARLAFQNPTTSSRQPSPRMPGYLHIPFSWVATTVRSVLSVIKNRTNPLSLKGPDLGTPVLMATPAAGALSGTSASGIDDFKPPKTPPPGPKGDTTQISTTLEKVKYPRPPASKSGTTVFKCPCCCQSLPESFRTGDRWK